MSTKFDSRSGILVTLAAKCEETKANRLTARYTKPQPTAPLLPNFPSKPVATFEVCTSVMSNINSTFTYTIKWMAHIDFIDNN